MSDRKKILIVDDDKNIRTALSILLEEEGYDVDTAETGHEALDKTNSKIFNLVLLDFRLPDVEGTKLMRQIKDTIPKMRKIMLTGFPSMSNAVESVNFGADAFIVKPCDTNDLICKIKEQLKKQDEEYIYSQQKVAEYIESQFRNKI